MGIEKGFILILTLLYLTLLSGLALAAMDVAQLQMAMNHYSIAAQREERALATALHQGEILLQGEELPVCVLERQTDWHKPPTWWQRHGCRWQSQSLHGVRVFELLAHDACGVVAESSVGVDYWRITVMLEDRFQQQHLVQQVMPLVNNNLADCNGPTHTVSLGSRTWRERYA